MLKVYHLTLKDLQPAGYAQQDLVQPMNFGGTVEVDAPAKADFSYIPIPLRETTMDRHRLKRIVEHCRLDPLRTVAYDCSDFDEDYGDTVPDLLFIRCNTKGWMKRRMPRTISWPWAVENFKQLTSPPAEGFAFEVTGHMWKSNKVRKYSCLSVKSAFGKQADIALHRKFFGYVEGTSPDAAKALKEAMKGSLRASRLALCPASIDHVFPYRFYEAMSAGRVPILVCSDYVLPWQDKIDWDSCTLRFEADQAREVGALVKEWRSRTDETRIVEMGRRARKIYEDWLDPDKWPDLMTKAIEQRLRHDGLLPQ